MRDELLPFGPEAVCANRVACAFLMVLSVFRYAVMAVARRVRQVVVN